MAATEGFGELSGLPVANVVGYFTHRHVAASEHLGRAVHPYCRQVLTEGRMTNFSESALKLSPGRGDAVSELVKCQLLAVFVLNDRSDLLVEI